MKRVLVTGGAGYIGSHLCRQLAAAGIEPITYDNLSRGHAWAVQWGPLEVGDIRDFERLTAVMARYRPEAVIHFAALAYVGESMSAPDLYYDNNVTGSLTLLRAMVRQGIERIVFSSTCATYGHAQVVPIDEQHPQRPINPYGQSKAMVERMLADFAEPHGLRSLALRYFNAAGADPEGRIGEAHTPETHLIPIVLEAALGQRDHVSVFGDDYDTPDGSCIRDYVHVDDLARAHLLGLASLDRAPGLVAYNLGNGQGFSVREVIETARQITGRPIEVRTGPRRDGDPARLVGDARLIQAELGWRPQFPELGDIVDTAWRWHLGRHRQGD